MNPDGSSANGILRYASVFGPLLNTPAKADCSDAIVGATSSFESTATMF
jgi:hypothetical protein